MRIHTDHNGLGVIAVAILADGTDVKGYCYDVLVAGHVVATIDFQRGAVPENGLNGLTNEALLDILIHHITHQNSKLPCKQNEKALVGLDYALRALEERTADRIERGVEGLEVA